MEILELLFGFEERFGPVPDGVGFFDEFLCLFAIIPEVVSPHQGIDFAEALLGLWDVKETSAGAKVCQRR